MSARVSAPWTPVRAGLQRGLLEFKHTLTSVQDMLGFLLPTGIAMVVMMFLRNVDIPGAPVSLGSMSLPSLLGMNVAFGGLVGITQLLAVEREDGTLLRAKAIPGGMTAYLIGGVVSTSAFTVIATIMVLIPGLFVFDGVGGGPLAWLGLLGVIALGLVATMPIGAAFGSMFESPRSAGLVMLPTMALVATSGIFYPLSQYPVWLQWVGQVFPIYWLGLGMRSALLPDAMAAVEIGHSWRTLEMIVVLGAWAVIGLILAPALLRRMARRESGAKMAARRERALQRVH